MTPIDCSACGTRLHMEEGFPEGGRFVCARCGLIAENTEATRAFRWTDLDPYMQRFGATRTNMVFGLVGASLWLPLLHILLIVRNSLDLELMAALALPYVAVLVSLFFLRARRPATLYMALTWVIFGVYLAYLRLLFEWRPQWGELVIGPGSHSVSRTQLLAASLFCAFSGAAVYLFYRLQARKLPKFWR